MIDEIPMITCPFCLKLHPASDSECPTTHAHIPRSYVRAMQERKCMASMLTIGYSGHGKTCYLASLLHSLYYGDPSRAWPGFSFIGLNQSTLDRVHDSYVSVLNQGVLPERTSEFVPDSLILQMSQVPIARKLGPLVIGHAPGELVLNLYDIGGEVYTMEQSISERISIIAELPNLVFLVDLLQIRREAEISGRGAVQQLHGLLNTVLNALDELGQVGRKGIIVCFTKADQLWGDPDFGPLAEQSKDHLPAAGEMKQYMAHLRTRSDLIGTWVQLSYPAFYNALVQYFKPVAFTTVSALGVEPEDQTVAVVRPSGIIDPLLWTLKMEGYM